MNNWKTWTIWTVLGLMLLTVTLDVTGTYQPFYGNGSTVKVIDVLDTSKNTLPTNEATVVKKTKQVLNVKIPENNIVVLLDQIGMNAQSIAAELTEKANKSNGQPIYLLISSPGGSVLDGAMIINAMEASPVPIHTVCLDLCASMAAIIHQYGNTRLMVDRSILMFHDASGQFSGPFPHIKSNFTTIERYILRFNQYISTKSGMPLADLVTAEHNELWIDAEDSLQRNFTDKLVFIQVVSNKRLQNFDSFISKYKTDKKSKNPLNLTW